jgi:hypothetical protein
LQLFFACGVRINKRICAERYCYCRKHDEAD